jgi:hypothetical protein
VTTPDSFSDSYVVVERMIHLGEIVFAELEPLLEVLEEQELITPVEHRGLLELARKTNLDQSPRS